MAGARARATRTRLENLSPRWELVYLLLTLCTPVPMALGSGPHHPPAHVAITSVNDLASQATMPARAIATAAIVGIGLTLTMMPWEHGLLPQGLGAPHRGGLAIVLNAAAIVATVASGQQIPGATGVRCYDIRSLGQLLFALPEDPMVQVQLRDEK